MKRFFSTVLSVFRGIFDFLYSVIGLLIVVPVMLIGLYVLCVPLVLMGSFYDSVASRFRWKLTNVRNSGLL